MLASLPLSRQIADSPHRASCVTGAAVLFSTPQARIRQLWWLLVLRSLIEVTLPAFRKRDDVAVEPCAGGLRRSVAMQRHGVTRTATRIGRATLGGEAGRLASENSVKIHRETYPFR